VSECPYHVVGTRTFAAEVLDFARAAGLNVVGLLEPLDRDRVGSKIHDLPVQWLEEASDACSGRVLIGTGQRDRREIVGRVAAARLEIATLVHPHAHISVTTRIGTGAIVGPGVVVGACSTIGEHVVCARGALIGHHSEVGDFATLGPGVNVAGNVRIEADAFLGMGAVIRDHLTIGSAAVVGMGAVVVADVAPGVDVRGFPATPVGSVGQLAQPS
jgi:acetyltransferase EpsM